MTWATTPVAAPAGSSSGAPPSSAADILARARDLAPHLRERSAEIEANRRLPDDVVDLLRATGVYRMGFSRESGGPELSSIEQLEVIEALSYGDASAGWCAEIGSHTGLFATYLDPRVAGEMFPSLDTITAGALFPVGRAELVPGGYRLSGRWPFGSGISHCDWVISGALIYRDGKPEPSPDGTVPHDSRLFMVRVEDVEVVGTWDTTGMIGTGSRDYMITDVFVPDERSLSFDTVRDPSGAHTQPEAFMRYMPGVPLGVARAALDHVRGLVEAGVRGGVRWADDRRAQITIAECEADFAATRHGVHGALRRLAEVLAMGGGLEDLTTDERAALPLSRLHSFRVARSIVRRLYDLLQTAAIHRSSPMDRWLRDTTTMCQHVFAQDVILQSGGAHLLGGTPDFQLCLGIVK